MPDSLLLDVITMHVVGNVQTYQIYPLGTTVCKFSAERNVWLYGQIVTMKAALPEESGVNVQTTYDVLYEDDVEEKDLTLGQITERISNNP